MTAAISWDQTLLSLALSLVVGGVAYRLAANVLRKQEIVRRLRRRREALGQVLTMLDGPAGEYLRDPTLDYPQRDMVELERRALQAQLLYWTDLEIQKALRDMSYPDRHRQAAERLGAVARELDGELGLRGT